MIQRLTDTKLRASHEVRDPPEILTFVSGLKKDSNVHTGFFYNHMTLSYIQ
jgi:hypothetical protein